MNRQNLTLKVMQVHRQYTEKDNVFLNNFCSSLHVHYVWFPIEENLLTVTLMNDLEILNGGLLDSSVKVEDV